jgi:hypothetical protein
VALDRDARRHGHRPDRQPELRVTPHDARMRARNVPRLGRRWTRVHRRYLDAQYARPSFLKTPLRTLARGRCVPWFAPGTNGQEVAVPPRSGPGTARIAPSACLSLPPARQLGQEVADTPQSGRTAPLRSHPIPLGPSAQACSTGNDRPTSRRFRAPDGRLLLRRQRSAKEGPDSCPTWPFVAPPANARTGPSRAPHARA